MSAAWDGEELNFAQREPFGWPLGDSVSCQPMSTPGGTVGRVNLRPHRSTKSLSAARAVVAGSRNQSRSCLNPAADGDQRAGDGTGGIAGQKQDHVGQFFRGHPFGEIRLRHAGAIGCGIDGRRQDRVDGDAALPFGGQRLGEAMYAGF